MIPSTCNCPKHQDISRSSCEKSEQKSSDDRGHQVHLPTSCSVERETRPRDGLTWLFVSKSSPLMTFTSARGSRAPASSVQMRFVAFTKRVRCTVAPRSESSWRQRPQPLRFALANECCVIIPESQSLLQTHPTARAGIGCLATGHDTRCSARSTSRRSSVP